MPASERRPRVPPRVGEAVQRALRRAGYELHAYPPPTPVDPDDERRAKLIAAQAIGVVLDVGANAGQYAQRLRATGFAGRIVSFEPVAAAYAQLERAAAADPLWQARRLAVGDAGGEVELDVAGNAGASSSLLAMGARHLESAPDSAYVGSERVRAARLDAIWDELVPGDERVWLKLDVQGFELHALRGAGERLATVACVQTELSLVPLYEGAPGWLEVVAFLAERDFELAGLEPGFADPRTGRVLQVDGLFVRS
jgi:FkbM family methyltransferase